MCTFPYVTEHALVCWGHPEFFLPAFSFFLSPPLTKTSYTIAFSLRNFPILQILHRTEFLQSANDLGESSHEDFSYLLLKKETRKSICSHLWVSSIASLFLLILHFYPLSSAFPHLILMSLLLLPLSSFPLVFWTNSCNINSLRCLTLLLGFCEGTVLDIKVKSVYKVYRVTASFCKGLIHSLPKAKEN